jgi:two-component system, OmpR family, sensor kinase
MSSNQPSSFWRSVADWSVSGWSLRRRLLVGVLGLLAVVCLLIGVVSTVAVRQSLIDQLDRRLAAASTRSAGPPGDHGPYRGPDIFPPGQPVDTIAASVYSGQFAEAAILMSSPNGMTSPASLTDAERAPLLTVPADGHPYTVTLGGDLGQYRVVAVVQPDRNGDKATVITGLPLSPVQETVWQLVLIESTVGGAALILAGLAGAFIVRGALRPLRRVVATARRVSELDLAHGEVDLSVRVPEKDTDRRTEVGQVGAALNRMLGHVGGALAVRHASETRVRQFVADASHELRTPLAAIRGYAELTRRGRDAVPGDVAHALGRIESESARMTTLVDDLLLLARLDSGRPLDSDPVELSGLVVDTVNDAHAASRDHVWRLDLPDDPVTVTGDGARLHQVLANLLANARTHTPPGTVVTTSLAVAADGCATVTVADNGPGIPPSVRPDIFERFARGDTSRSRAAGSTGLGLAIVSAVVDAHHGKVEVTSRPGHTTFTVRLPGAAVRHSDLI